VKRMAVCSFVLFVCLFCLTVQAQEQEGTQPEKVPCIHASHITRDNAAAIDKQGVWTTATSTQDGLLSLTYCGVFKSGQTTVNRLAVNQLNELPAGFEPHRKYGEMVGEKIQVRNLPPGFTVYKDMAFEIRTEAIPDMKYLTFRLPSVQSEEEFSKLVVLYLDEGQLLPGALQWRRSDLGLDIPKTDFKTKTLSAGFDFATVFNHATYIGRVVVASFNRAEYDKSPLDLYISSVVGPPYVKVGETFTYSVTIVNGGANPIPASEVVFLSNMSNGEFMSVTSTQGRCRKSVNSDPDTVCDLGTVDARKSVVISITVKAEASGMMDYYGEEVFTTRNMVYGREKDYIPENNSYESRGTIIRR
jgi:Domain of unknown function DUF11